MAAAGVDPYQHFQTFGWREGRDPNALFDTAGYLAAYQDVATAGVNPLDHYNAFGWHEGRDPSVGFDTASYLAAYADVAAAGVNPLTHYLAVRRARGPLGLRRRRLGIGRSPCCRPREGGDPRTQDARSQGSARTLRG